MNIFVTEHHPASQLAVSYTEVEVEAVEAEAEADRSTEENKFDIDALFAKKQKAVSAPEQKTNKKQKTDHKQPKQVPQTRKPFGEDLPISMLFTSHLFVRYSLFGLLLFL